MRSAFLGAVALLVIAAPSASASTVASLPSGASVLFSLEAAGGTFERVPGHPRRHTLTLRGVARGTTWFADRPKREAGRITTRSLLRSWKRLGYAAEPPNAAVVLDGGRRAQDTVALELRLVRHDDRRRTARFKVRVLQGLGAGLSHLNRELDRRLPKRFTGASVFIDDVTSTSCTVGQPRLFGFSRLSDSDSYVQADGRYLPVGDYPALFQLYGTQFGGDASQQAFRLPDLEPPVPGMSWQICADGASPNFNRMPECPTGALVLWSLGDTPASAVNDDYWLPADGRTVAAADYPTFALRYLPEGPPPTFALPNVPAPPGFVYLVCVYGDDDTGTSVELPYVGQVDLFTLRGYPDDRLEGGLLLGIPQNMTLFQVIGTTFGGDGVEDFQTPKVPSPITQYSYRTAGYGLYPPG